METQGKEWDKEKKKDRKEREKERRWYIWNNKPIPEHLKADKDDDELEGMWKPEVASGEE